MIDEKMTFNRLKIAMILAPMCFVISMIIIAPQQDSYLFLVGNGHAFLSSLKAENSAWTYSHIFMLVGCVLYLPAFFYMYQLVIRKNKLLGELFLAIAWIGVLGLIGQIAIDFVYGVLSKQTDLATMQKVRVAILEEPIINILFNAVANIGFLLGMFAASIIALITNWIPRLTGVLIIAGWLTIILLNGKIPYIEAVGHFLILIGFIFVILRKKEAE